MPACPFCDIASGASAAHVVHATESVVSFLDRNPLFLGHILVVPRRHVPTLTELQDEELAPLLGEVRLVAAALVTALGCDGTFVANNNVVSQSVAHLHVHVVPRRRGDGLRGFFWPRQRYASVDEADEFAVRIREAMPGA
jgi:histidine triad (HIT) family protein